MFEMYAAIVLASFSIGAFAGHAVGYGRGRRATVLRTLIETSAAVRAAAARVGRSE